jgi:8-oxo-dGTP diphosphatase
MTDTTPETARLVVDVALFGQRDGDLHILVIRRGRGPYEGCWALPGGRVDVGEETLDAAYRELIEETGLTVVALRVVGVYSSPDRDPRGRYVDFAYTSWLPNTPPPTAGDDAAEAEWIPVAELLSTAGSLAFDHDHIISDALRVIRDEAKL